MTGRINSVVLEFDQKSMALASKINNQIDNSQILMQNTMNEMHDKF